jgi:hypothetical protein
MRELSFERLFHLRPLDFHEMAPAVDLGIQKSDDSNFLTAPFPRQRLRDSPANAAPLRYLTPRRHGLPPLRRQQDLACRLRAARDAVSLSL